MKKESQISRLLLCLFDYRIIKLGKRPGLHLFTGSDAVTITGHVVISAKFLF